MHAEEVRGASASWPPTRASAASRRCALRRCTAPLTLSWSPRRRRCLRARARGSRQTGLRAHAQRRGPPAPRGDLERRGAGGRRAPPARGRDGPPGRERLVARPERRQRHRRSAGVILAAVRPPRYGCRRRVRAADGARSDPQGGCSPCSSTRAGAAQTTGGDRDKQVPAHAHREPNADEEIARRRSSTDSAPTSRRTAASSPASTSGARRSWPTRSEESEDATPSSRSRRHPRLSAKSSAAQLTDQVLRHGMKR